MGEEKSFNPFLSRCNPNENCIPKLLLALGKKRLQYKLIPWRSQQLGKCYFHKDHGMSRKGYVSAFLHAPDPILISKMAFYI